jgi:hypothetical protein
MDIVDVDHQNFLPAVLQPQIEQGEVQPAQEEPFLQNQHMQIGVALMLFDQWNSVFKQLEEEARFKRALQMWDNLSNQGNSESLTVRIPANWIPFFTALVGSAETFSWAKQFVVSGAPALLEDSFGNLSLPLPKSFRAALPADNTMDHVLTVANSIPLENGGTEGKTGKAPLETEDSLPARKKRASKRLTPIVDTEVRRSNRVKELHQGFKSADGSHKKCAHCHPPTLSSKMIKNLGMQFCSMKEEDLEDDKLNKGGSKGPVAKKKSKAQEDKPSAGDGSESNIPSA